MGSKPWTFITNHGLVLNYIFRRSFRDYNANGRIDGNAEMIDITSIETSFVF